MNYNSQTQSTILDALNSDQKAILNALKPGERRIVKNWKSGIEKAKTLVKRYDEVRMGIAKVSIETLDICHGGRSYNGQFTLKAFAKEIGLSPSTLAEWCAIYRNTYSQLPGTKQKETYSFYRHVHKTVGPSPSKKRVLTVFNNLKKKGPEYLKFEKYIKHLKSMEFNSKRDVLLEGATIEQLSELQHICRNVAFNIQQFFNAQDGIKMKRKR